MTTTRRQYIGKIVSDAMRVLSLKYPDIPFDDRPAHPICIVEWAIETPEITAQQAVLDEAMAVYVENESQGILEVKAAYQAYAHLHQRWFYGALLTEAPK